MADYTNAQKVVINRWQQGEREFEAGARARAAKPPRPRRVKAPKAIGGAAQPVSGSKRRYGSGGTPAPHKPAAAPAPSSPQPAPGDTSLQSLIGSATRLRYGPQEQGFNNQLAQNARYTSGLGDWYANAVAQIQALRGQGQAQSAQNLANVQAYGTQPVLSNPTDQQAALARNSLNSEYGAMFARDAGADDSALGRVGAALQVQQGNTRNQANAERQQMLGGLAALKGQEGDFQTTYGAQLQAQSDKTATANQRNEIAAKALGIKVKELNKVKIPLAKSLEGDRAAGQRVARTNARTNKTNARTKKEATANQHTQDAINNAFKKNDLALKAYKLEHPNAGKQQGGNSSYSATKIQGFKDSFANATATAVQAKKHAKGGTSQDEVYTAMLGHFDADVAKAASLLAFGKSIPKDLRHRLATKGVHPKQATNTIADVVQGFLQGLGK